MNKCALVIVAIILSSCALSNTAAQQDIPNTLTDLEAEAGWVLLWDGETTNGWRSAKAENFPAKGWEIKDGVLSVLSSGGAESRNGGDIITTREYSSFEFQVDFRITSGANSGIKYFVDPDLLKGEGSAIGLEFQILDDDVHPDAKMGTAGNRTVGSLYDLIPAVNLSDSNTRQKHVFPPGSWNSARVVVRGNDVEHWLNGIKVVEYNRGTEVFAALVARSKYAKWPNFGRWEKGPILLQDHGDLVSFRNIKIREITPTQISKGQVIESGIYDWQDSGENSTTPGETRKLFDGSSDAFEYLYSAVTSVGAGESFVLPQDNEDLETLLIMKSGTLDQTIIDDRKQMGGGSVSLLMPGEKIEVDNNSPEPATLYAIMWRAKETDGGALVESTDNARSLLVDWNDATVVKIEKGSRRFLIDAPTTMVGQFRMHVTTLNEGMTSHPPHTHVEEEIILVRRGEVEESIDGKLHQVGADSLIFLRSMVPHGIRNIGPGQAEYFAFKWAPNKK